jgi:predicted nucleic acid-binding protein
LRDGDQRIAREVRSLGEAVLISVITRVALEGGVHRVPEESAIRRARLDLMLTAIPTLAFDDAAASAYGHIVSRSGYSRRKLLDRMIAAQALVHRATLVTMNRADFSDIDGLTLLTW